MALHLLYRLLQGRWFFRCGRIMAQRVPGPAFSSLLVVEKWWFSPMAIDAGCLYDGFVPFQKSIVDPAGRSGKGAVS
jgi:hypothetical protein